MTTRILTGGRPVLLRSKVHAYGTRGAYASVPLSLLGSPVWVDDDREESQVVPHGKGGARVAVSPDKLGQEVTVERRAFMGTPGAPDGCTWSLVVVRDGLRDLGFLEGHTLERFLALIEDDHELVGDLADMFRLMSQD